MMTKETKSSNRNRLLFVLLMGLALTWFVSTVRADQKPPDNRIVSITRVGSQVEIEVTSSREFPVRNELVVMNIGGREFSRSRSPVDGSLNTLIFILADEEFSRVSSGEEVSVYFGQADSGYSWRFGRLNKALLDKPKKK